MRENLPVIALMKLKLLLLGTLFSLKSFTQSDNPILKFCFLCAIDDCSFPTLQAGIEFGLNNRISLYTEAGIKYRKGYYENADSNIVTSKGFKLKTELRYYIHNKRYQSSFSSEEGLYLGLNCFYTRTRYNTSVSYFYRRDTSMRKDDCFGVKKDVVGLNVLVGRQKVMWKIFMFDVYTGIGVRFRSIDTVKKEIEYNQDFLLGPIDLTVYGIRNMIDVKGKKTIIPNLTLGIRFCYRL